MTTRIAGGVAAAFGAVLAFAATPAFAQSTYPAKPIRLIRAVAVTGTQRLVAMPEIPTVGESGLPGFEATIWLGLFAPAAVSKEIVARLNGEVGKVLQRVDVKGWMAQQGIDPVGGTPEQFSARIKADTSKWGAVIKGSGARID